MRRNLVSVPERPSRASARSHEFEVRMDDAAYQNFNLDYFQFDRVRR